jgi:hypothetical protein
MISGQKRWYSYKEKGSDTLGGERGESVKNGRKEGQGPGILG